MGKDKEKGSTGGEEDVSPHKIETFNAQEGAEEWDGEEEEFSFSSPNVLLCFSLFYCRFFSYTNSWTYI